MKHRHSGPSVRYKTRRGRVMSRKRPMHPITIKKKREGRRGSRKKIFGFGERKRNEEYSPEELDYLRDTYNREPEEIEKSEAEQAIEEFRQDKEDEAKLDELNESKYPGFGKKDITNWDQYTGD